MIKNYLSIKAKRWEYPCENMPKTKWQSPFILHSKPATGMPQKTKEKSRGKTAQFQ